MLIAQKYLYHLLIIIIIINAVAIADFISQRHLIQQTLVAMSGCHAGCYRILHDGSRRALSHDSCQSHGGYSFYYCSIHRVYHCMKHDHGPGAPHFRCGECAWLFFLPFEARKRPRRDAPENLAIDSMASPDWMDAPSQSPVAHDHRAHSHPQHDLSSAAALEETPEDPNPVDTSQPILEGTSNGHAVRSLSSLRDLTDWRASAPDTGDHPLYRGNNDNQLDGQGNTVMLDDSEGNPPVAPGTVHVPVRHREDAMSWIPHDNPAIYSISYSEHQRYKQLFVFNYIDVNGVPAVHPASDMETLQVYFAPLLHDERHCDLVLRQARLWSCYAQG
jgi:hypothetical protein